jgi:hypothetical protein
VQINEEIKLDYIRFDQELMTVDSINVSEKVEAFYQSYPIFFPAYTYGVLGIGGEELKGFKENLLSFSNNPISQEVYASIQKEYPSIDDVQASIDLAFSYYKYYFPEEATPRVFYMQSGFNQRIFVDSLVIGVALDMCLGESSEYYERLGLPIYLRSKMRRESIALDAMRGLAWSNFPFNSDDNLASNMIYEGKIQYFLDALFPNKSEAFKLSYSEADVEWLNHHRSDIWDAVIAEEMLYQTERMKIKNMMSDAPFTQQFGNNSPAKIGVWLGREIVKAYMDSHPEITLQDLMKNEDYISILNDSNFKP